MRVERETLSEIEEEPGAVILRDDEITHPFERGALS